MGHYAFLDNKNIVTQVIVGVDENELIEGKDPEIWYSEFVGQLCKRTSYNSTVRKNYAGIGFAYDAQRDAFIPPKPFASWLLDEESCRWTAPIPYPTDNLIYSWNEELLDWEAVIHDHSTSE